MIHVLILYPSLYRKIMTPLNKSTSRSTPSALASNRSTPLTSNPVAANKRSHPSPLRRQRIQISKSVISVYIERTKSTVNILYRTPTPGLNR